MHTQKIGVGGRSARTGSLALVYVLSYVGRLSIVVSFVMHMGNKGIYVQCILVMRVAARGKASSSHEFECTVTLRGGRAGNMYQSEKLLWKPQLAA